MKFVINVLIWLTAIRHMRRSVFNSVLHPLLMHRIYLSINLFSMTLAFFFSWLHITLERYSQSAIAVRLSAPNGNRVSFNYLCHDRLFIWATRDRLLALAIGLKDPICRIAKKITCDRGSCQEHRGIKYLVFPIRAEIFPVGPESPLSFGAESFYRWSGICILDKSIYLIIVIFNQG